MRYVTVTAGSVIDLGYQYDNEATTIIFPVGIVKPITDLYGTTGTFSIWYRRSGEADGYPIGSPLVTFENQEYISWLLTEAELAIPGSAQVQLRYVVDEVCVMSQIFGGSVADSVDVGDEVPEPMEAWADAIVEAAATVGPLSGLTDVFIQNLESGNILVYDGERSKWVNAETDEVLPVDSALSNSSEYPVQNKVVKAALDGKIGASDQAVMVTVTNSSGTISISGKEYDDIYNLLTHQRKVYFVMPVVELTVTNVVILVCTKIMSADNAIQIAGYNGTTYYYGELIDDGNGGMSGSMTTATIGGGGGASSLSGLSDVAITTPANGDILAYNSAADEWQNIELPKDVVEITGTLSGSTITMNTNPSFIAGYANAGKEVRLKVDHTLMRLTYYSYTSLIGTMSLMVFEGAESGSSIRTAVFENVSMSSSSYTGTLKSNAIPDDAVDIGAIPAPISPTSGDFLTYNGSAWVAQSLSTWQGGNY